MTSENKEPGLFICVEGIDGCGKTSISEYLTRRLRAFQRKDVHLIHDPGNTPIADAIRPLVLNKDLEMSPTEQLLLYTTARHSLATGIKPLLADGHDIVADRWMLSTYVYQGMMEGCDLKAIKRLHAEFVGIDPEIYILIDVDPEVGIARKAQVSGEDALDRFEVRDLKWRAKLRKSYVKAAKHFKYPIVDGNKPMPEVLEDIRAVCMKNERFADLFQEF
jgi:dTMP kinase